MEYKQASITPATAAAIERLKRLYAAKGTPMQAPAIIGIAVNNLVETLGCK